MDLSLVILYVVVFLFGVCVGSFLNVCIVRVPRGESIVAVSSHCMVCDRRLRWYELVPLVSWIALRGKCRGCRSRISVQYPVIEAVNGVLWVLTFMALGFTLYSLFCCLMISALIVLSVIDGRTGEIPLGVNIFILVLGFVNLAFNLTSWVGYAIGFFAVSLPLFIILIATGGRGIGGGDIKLMAVCGLFLGWKLVLLSFFLGCIIGSVIHIIRMKFFGASKVLALGPYLSIGVLIAMLWGNSLISWYIGML